MKRIHFYIYFLCLFPKIVPVFGELLLVYTADFAGKAQKKTQKSRIERVVVERKTRGIIPLDPDNYDTIFALIYSVLVNLLTFFFAKKIEKNKFKKNRKLFSPHGFYVFSIQLIVSPGFQISKINI